jgi:hypothetical protein
MRIALGDSDKGIADLKLNLVKFARATEIKRLESRGGPMSVSIEVAVWRTDPSCRGDCRYLPNDERQEKPYGKIGVYKFTQSAPPLKQGDLLTFVLRNEDQDGKSWYSYVLDISGDATIQTVFPTRHDNQEEALLKANETRDLPALLLLDTAGVEVIKLIFAREPIDASSFEGEGYRKGEMSPLERLLAPNLSTRGEVHRYPLNEWGTLQAEFQVGE